MPIHDRYFPGSSVSRYLPPGERSFGGVVTQSGRPITDADLNLLQDSAAEAQALLLRRSLPSGWLRGQGRHDSGQDYLFPIPGDVDFVSNAFQMRALTAVVAGLPVFVGYSNSTTQTNVVQLDAPPQFGGAPPDVKRTDFVFLEVWLALVSFSPHASGTVQVLPALPAPGDTVVVNGLPLTAVAAAPGVDQFLIGGDEFTTAANIAAALNSVANSFDTIVSASSAGTDTVTLRAVAAGAAGNAVTLSVTGAALVASGATLVGGVDEPNKPTQETIYRCGNTLSDPSVDLADDLADPVIDSETTKRVQVQYRLRVTGTAEAVNFQTQADGFSNANILAQGASGAPVAGYRFVRADNATVIGNSDATAYGIEDAGLWVAGDGSAASSNDLGTVDGFVYAVPVAFVFRRNDASQVGLGGAGFDPLSNTNGGLPSTHGGFVNPAVGVIPAGVSDRPDGYFSDGIVSSDVLDLRRHVSLASVDMGAELEYQVQSLLDGKNRTWAIDAADKNTLGAGSGDVSTRFLVCNQVGRSAAKGGVAPTSGSTTRGDTIRDFDHCARRFGSQPIVEVIALGLLPTDTSVSNPGKYVIQANGGYAGWAEDDEIHLDLAELNATMLGDFDPASVSFTGTGAFPNNASIFAFVPPGTVISNVLRVQYDDGHYTVAIDQRVQMKTIVGIGTTHVVLTLDRNDDLVNGGDPVNPDHRVVGDSGTDDGSARRIFVELEVTYPLGVGTTDTPDGAPSLVPDVAVYPVGPILENNTAQRPTDWQGLLSPAFRDGYREVKLEYAANQPGSGIGSGTPISDQIISRNSTELVFPRRVYGSAVLVTGVTDSVAAQAHNVDTALTEYGSSSRLVTVSTAGGPMGSPLSGAGQTLCAITYFAQDPLPNYGALGGGYQVGVYYRSVVKATVGSRAGVMAQLPDPLTVNPLATSKSVWTAQAGKGSADLPFPYANALDYIPVNDGGSGAFTGEWFFAATAAVSVSNFDAETGLLDLHAFTSVDGTAPLTFQTRVKDVEFRAIYTGVDPAVYRPTAMGQPLSNVARHKSFTAVLARATENSVLFRKDEVLLVIISRFSELDDVNSVFFSDAGNRTGASIFRTRNLLTLVGE